MMTGRCTDLYGDSVAEYESMQETMDLLADDDALSDLRQSREDFAAGNTFDAAQVRAELEQRRGKSPTGSTRTSTPLRSTPSVTGGMPTALDRMVAR